MRYFYSFLLTITFLFANTNLEFESALKLFKSAQYQKAFEAFEALVEQDPTSLESNFYFARSAFILKRVNVAIAAYERILINDPYNNRTKLELGRIYFILGKYDISKQYFNEVLASRPPKKVQESVAVYIKKIKDRDNISHLTGIFQFGFVYDSNINSASNEENFFVPLLNLNLTNSSLDEEDWAHHELLVLNHVLDTSKIFGFVIKNDFTIYNKSFQEYGTFDIRFMNHSPSASWKIDNLFVDVGLSRDLMWYGGEKLLENFGPFIKLDYKSTTVSRYSLTLKTFEKRYDSLSNQSKDARMSNITFSYLKQIDSVWSWYFKEFIQRERKFSGSDATIDNDIFDTTLGFYYLTQRKNRWHMSLGHRNLAYKDQDPFFLSDHIEDRLTLQLSYTMQWSHGLSFETLVTGLQNDSTTATTQYERATVMFNVAKKF